MTMSRELAAMLAAGATMQTGPNTKIEVIIDQRGTKLFSFFSPLLKIFLLDCHQCLQHMCDCFLNYAIESVGRRQ